MSAALDRAITLATRLHTGQTDKQGQPYILHCLRVMIGLGWQADEDSRIVAVLHDVLEDTPVTEDELRGFSDAALCALEAITRREGEEYFRYIERCALNSIARHVKIADVLDNLDKTRPRPAEDCANLYERYRKALLTLRIAAVHDSPAEVGRR